MNNYTMPPQVGYAIGQPFDPKNAPAPAYGAAPMPAPGAYPYYAPAPARKAYAFSGGDAVFACFALALGFLCWEWRLTSAFGGFLIFALALAGALAYLRKKGVRQTRRSVAAFAVCVLGALPFLLYDQIVINSLLTLFEICACLYWFCVSAGTSVEQRLSGFIIVDGFNQIFVVPFSNFLSFFVSLGTAAKYTKRGKSVLIGAIGLCVAIPLLIAVTSLLTQADSGFEKFTEDFAELFGLSNIAGYLLEIIGGVPIACYLCGAIFGNAQKRYTERLTKGGAEKSLAALRRIPRAALAAPLIVLCVLYILFMAVMGAYLFSAFGGELPASFTYADYARKGFFELCGVATINLVAIAFTYGFAKRDAGEYPEILRVGTGVLCLMTELLIATAVSKMLLYVGAYGLSRLRVYTLWFLVLLAVVFAILFVWHILPLRKPAGAADGTGAAAASPARARRPFHAGRPVAAAFVCMFLALFLANTDGLIARYNVWQYESGVRKTVDTAMLSQMSDAVTPYLARLAETASEYSVRLDAANALRVIHSYHVYGRGMLSGPDSFRDWNVQTELTQKYYITESETYDRIVP